MAYSRPQRLLNHTAGSRTGDDRWSPRPARTYYATPVYHDTTVYRGEPLDHSEGNRSCHHGHLIGALIGGAIGIGLAFLLFAAPVPVVAIVILGLIGAACGAALADDCTSSPSP